MKLVQYRILTKILNHVEIPSYIYGFEQGKSIPVMSKVHIGKSIVISLDIKDFFPSIKQYMVGQAFNDLGIGETPARILSELCTYKSYVPQGSLTAPKISNIIISGTFGKELHDHFQKEGIALTIYADDITISYNESKDVPREVSRAKVTELITFITKSVEKYGFRINREKTKIMRQNVRQWVCGVVVNQKVNMKRDDKYRLKAIVNNCVKNGIVSEAQKVNMNSTEFIRKYAGRINWLCQLNMDVGAKLKVAFRRISANYLKDFPEVEIPELAWNSSIETVYVPEPEDDMIFNNGTGAQENSETITESPFK